MGSKKQPHNAAFREGTVRIMIETGKQVPEADELGINGMKAWRDIATPYDKT
ncbi:hypothetical protein PYK79_38590 [Streptomyces sp. ID05-04B]|uniref:hypothetical protein n=1 Tax=unclassified Streptomyces TaxID=2593676 RepID=UPI00131F4239|nr:MULTISPECIES: hypothetical protein [unclassified Streptomyces]MDX5567995.1 hypothetical protein [Streptomyces sp. ID05-04B]